MRILAIDPGTTQSAYVETDDGAPRRHAIVPNEQMLEMLRPWTNEMIPSRQVTYWRADVLAIEWVSFYGKEIHAGSETFDTCRWVGRFQQAWNNDATCVLIPRRKIRQDLCGTMKAGDAEVRAVLIDRYGGKEKAIGRKATPGPLYGIASHVWSALAVAVTHADALNRLAADALADKEIPF